MLKKLARKVLDVADNLCALASPPGHARAGTLTTLLFHSIYRNREEISSPQLAPHQDITVEDLQRCIGHILDSGFTAVTPAQVDAGLDPAGKYVMITFDHGYYNNTRALDVLERFQTPATFFVSTDHVLEQKGFWWDALHRELSLAGASAGTRRRSMERAKSLSAAHIEAALVRRHGRAVLRPRSDLDRPMTPAELKDFAANRWVHIGNHTRNHAILTNCSVPEMKQQIEGCQQAMRELVGYAPLAIAYPNGDYSRDAIAVAEAAGLRIGFTVRPCKNRLPLVDGASRMELGRFMPHGKLDMGAQWRKFNAAFVPSHRLKLLMTSPY